LKYLSDNFQEFTQDKVKILTRPNQQNKIKY